MSGVSETLAARLHRRAGASRWAVSLPAFTAALENAAAAKGSLPAGELARFLDGLHLEDLALACACAAGHDQAWEHFVLEHRPGLYRAADALDPAGGARELADSLYADLYGTNAQDGERRSLFRYFHGRGSLSTWLRAVLAQRHVDAIRARRRLEPLPEDDGRHATVSPVPLPADPDRTRYLSLIHHALALAVALLSARDRLRLSCYYAEQLTLAQTGRLLGEHEATVSRQLARTRRDLRKAVERRLRVDLKLHEDQVARCFEIALEDPGTLDLSRLIRKDPEPDRSI